MHLRLLAQQSSNEFSANRWQNAPETHSQAAISTKGKEGAINTNALSKVTRGYFCEPLALASRPPQ
jgi:hypothetical protein